MREKTTLMSQNEGKGQKRKLAGAALATVLLLTPTVASAQEANVSEKNQDKKEIVAKTPIVAKSDSNITWEEAVSGPNLEPNPEGGEISQKEIQEFMKNHKDEFIENNDKEVAEAVYKEIMENKDVQKLIKEMVNRKDIRGAVLDRNEEYIEQEIYKFILCEKLKIMGGGAFIGIFLLWLIHRAFFDKS